MANRQAGRHFAGRIRADALKGNPVNRLLFVLRQVEVPLMCFIGTRKCHINQTLCFVFVCMMAA